MIHENLNQSDCELKIPFIKFSDSRHLVELEVSWRRKFSTYDNKMNVDWQALGIVWTCDRTEHKQYRQPSLHVIILNELMLQREQPGMHD